MASEIGVQKLMHTNATQAATINSSGQLIVDDGLHVSEGGAVNMSIGQGLIKGWTRFNGSSTISDSLNTSSITDRATGKYQMNHSNNMGNANYVVHFSHGGTSYTSVSGKLGNYYDNPNIATDEYHVMIHSSTSFYDEGFCCCSMSGDLA